MTDRHYAALGATPGLTCPRCASTATWAGDAPAPGFRGWRFCTSCGRYWDKRSDVDERSAA